MFTHIFQEYVPNVLILCYRKCFHVASVYLEVAYVAMTIHVCCKCMFQIFFGSMLQVFYLDVAYIAVAIHMLRAYVSKFLSVSDVCCSKCFMIQVFSLAGT
jgi:hypothetical protein